MVPKPTDETRDPAHDQVSARPVWVTPELNELNIWSDTNIPKGTSINDAGTTKPLS